MYSSQRTYCSSFLIVTAAVSLFVRLLVKGGSCVCVRGGGKGLVRLHLVSCVYVCGIGVRKQVLVNQCNLTIINTLVVMRTEMDLDRVTLGRCISGELADMEGLT